MIYFIEIITGLTIVMLSFKSFCKEYKAAFMLQYSDAFRERFSIFVRNLGTNTAF